MCGASITLLAEIFFKSTNILFDDLGRKVQPPPDRCPFDPILSQPLSLNCQPHQPHHLRLQRKQRLPPRRPLRRRPRRRQRHPRIHPNHRLLPPRPRSPRPIPSSLRTGLVCIRPHRRSSKRRARTREGTGDAVRVQCAQTGRRPGVERRGAVVRRAGEGEALRGAMAECEEGDAGFRAVGRDGAGFNVEGEWGGVGECNGGGVGGDGDGEGGGVGGAAGAVGSEGGELEFRGGVGGGGLWRREGGGCGEDGEEEEEGGKRGEHSCRLGGEDVQLVKGFTVQIWREENSHCSQIGELKPCYKKQSLVEACKGSYLWAAAKEDSEAASPAEPPRCSDSAWSLGHHPQTKSRKPDKSNPNALTPTTKLIEQLRQPSFNPHMCTSRRAQSVTG